MGEGGRVGERERGGDRNKRVSSVLVSVYTHAHTRTYRAGQDRTGHDRTDEQGRKGKIRERRERTALHSTVRCSTVRCGT